MGRPTEISPGGGKPTDTAPALPASFYRLVERLLPLPEIGSLSFRGDADFELLRIACAEHLRRSPDAESLPVHEGFVVNVLDARGRWSESVQNDDASTPRVPAWMSWVQFWDEGLGPERDFLIETPPSTGLPLSRLLVEGDSEWKVVVSFLEPALASAGYRWFHHPDRFALGIHLDEKRIQRIIDDWLR